MNPTLTIVLILAGALLGVAALTATVHYQWLSYDVAIWIAMFVVFMAWRALQPALHRRANDQRKPR